MWLTTLTNPRDKTYICIGNYHPLENSDIWNWSDPTFTA